MTPGVRKPAGRQHDDLEPAMECSQSRDQRAIDVEQWQATEQHVVGFIKRFAHPGQERFVEVSMYGHLGVTGRTPRVEVSARLGGLKYAPGHERCARRLRELCMEVEHADLLAHGPLAGGPLLGLASTGAECHGHVHLQQRVDRRDLLGYPNRLGPNLRPWRRPQRHHHLHPGFGANAGDVGILQHRVDGRGDARRLGSPQRKMSFDQIRQQDGNGHLGPHSQAHAARWRCGERRRATRRS